jgi:hypothetical protein
MSSRPHVIAVETETIGSDAYRQLGGMSGVSAAVKRFYKEMCRVIRCCILCSARAI